MWFLFSSSQPISSLIERKANLMKSLIKLLFLKILLSKPPAHFPKKCGISSRHGQEDGTTSDIFSVAWDLFVNYFDVCFPLIRSKVWVVDKLILEKGWLWQSKYHTLTDCWFEIGTGTKVLCFVRWKIKNPTPSHYYYYYYYHFTSICPQSKIN